MSTLPLQHTLASKLDPGLQRELAVVEGTKVRDRVIPVLIERVGLGRPTTRPGRKGLEEMAINALTDLQGITSHLRKIHAKKIETLRLANAVAAELTPRQVRAMAADPQVKLIRLARPQRVTA